MASEAYELFALLMRYVFVLIGGLILFRAYRWMRRDARNYRREMRSLPDAGLVGEIVDLQTGKSQPLPREGDMGASRECDIWVRGSGVMRHHCQFKFEEGKGMLIIPARRAAVLMSGQKMVSPAHALHGTQLQLGNALLRVRLFAGLKIPQPVSFQPDLPAETAFPAAEEPGYAQPVLEEEEEGFSFPGQEEPLAPFEFPDVIEGDVSPNHQPADGAVYAPGAAPTPDYDGHYTEDGQMTWQYAYSLEDLYRAQAEWNQQQPQQPPSAPESWEENDEALPYESPVPRRKRRRRQS